MNKNLLFLLTTSIFFYNTTCSHTVSKFLNKKINRILCLQQFSRAISHTKTPNDTKNQTNNLKQYLPDPDDNKIANWLLDGNPEEIIAQPMEIVAVIGLLKIKECKKQH